MEENNALNAIMNILKGWCGSCVDIKAHLIISNCRY